MTNDSEILGGEFTTEMRSVGVETFAGNKFASRGYDIYFGHGNRKTENARLTPPRASGEEELNIAHRKRRIASCNVRLL